MYSYAKLSKYDFSLFRFLGVGLGNLLLPWARSVVAAKKYGLIQIEPTWPQLKVGPILRCEKDFRFYGDLFSRLPEEVGGFKKIFLLTSSRKINESLLKNSELKNYKDKNSIFIFEGLGDYFEPILKDHNLIYSELLKRTKDTHKLGLKYDFSNCVCMHIRRGDFKMEKWDTPIEWFCKVSDDLKNKLGSDIKFKIFSDGLDDELAPILKQKNTERLFFGSALADLIALSHSNILVASFNSTFSMWASYLGRMPTIWPQNGLSHLLHYELKANEIEFFKGNDLPESFIINCKKNVFKNF